MYLRTAGHTRHVLMSSRTAPSKRASHKAGRCQFRRLPTPSLQFFTVATRANRIAPSELAPSLARGEDYSVLRATAGRKRSTCANIHEIPRFQPSPCHSNSICNAQLVDAEDGVRQLKRAGGATELTAQVPFYVFCLADHATLVSVPSGTHRMGYPGHLLFEPAVAVAAPRDGGSFCFVCDLGALPVAATAGVRGRNRGPSSMGTVRYEEREVQLSHLTGLDFFVSYWSEGLVGHTFLSFIFDNAPPLSISIETRPEVGEGFNPVASLFKQFELICVVGERT